MTFIRENAREEVSNGSVTCDEPRLCLVPPRFVNGDARDDECDIRDRDGNENVAFSARQSPDERRNSPMLALGSMQQQPVTRRDLADAALCASFVLVLTTILFLVNRPFFWKDDFQLQYLPASHEVIRAWSEGSFPLLSRFSWFGGALAGEYQHGVFSVFLTLCNAVVWALPLSLHARAAALSILHLSIAAAGATLLARSYAIRGAYAWWVGVIASLNGWMLWWGAATWYPSLTAFAWLPWYWLAIRRIAAGSRWAWLGAALALYCLMTAGWPYTVLMMAIVTALEAGRCLFRKSFGAVARIAMAAALGMALSAPATLMLLEYFKTGWRLQSSGALDARWIVPLWGLVGLILPTSQTLWRLWVVQVPHSAVELAGALVPIAGLAAIAGSRRWRFFREYSAEIVIVLALILLTQRASPGVFRWPFRWLPLLHLFLALAGVAAAQQVRRMALGVAIAATVVVALLIDATLDMHFMETARYAALVLGACGVWALCRGRAAAGAGVALACAPVAILFFLFPQPSEVAQWHLDDSILKPPALDRSRRYLSMAQWWDDVTEANPTEPYRRPTGRGESLWLGDTPMFGGLEFINGYSPVGPFGMRALLGFDTHGPVRPEYVTSILVRESQPGALLDHMSVDGLLVANSLVEGAGPLLAQRGWKFDRAVPDGALFTRTLRHLPAWSAGRSLQFLDDREQVQWILTRPRAPMPVTFTGAERSTSHYGPRLLTDFHNERNSASVRVGPSVSGESSLIVFSRAWYPGFHATIDGKEIPVLRADLMMPAVILSPSERGLLEIRYRPRALIVGGAIAIAGVLAVIAGCIVTARRSPTSSARLSAPGD